ncbi:MULTISPECIES: biotin transporter BioY [unclassified Granulicatella]|uniref:biotin transporter BioY n=1 Tax=unclassified Granulicatella TaxID=2630493 RepID=UPI00142F9C13|nr:MULTISPECIES: biotin transporter BioY [unclassified Granulicatella]MBF0780374.1 biotin transporter BioY [Granulicatella sp. 19428wC4_WM01]
MKTKHITLSALLAVLLFISSYFRIPLGFIPPITLQTFFVILIGLVLKPKYAFISTSASLIFQILFQGILSSPQFGFAAGFIVASTTLAILVNLSKKSWYTYLCVMIASLLIYAVGIPYFVLLASNPQIFAANSAIEMLVKILHILMLPYLIGDAIKAILAIIVAKRMHILLHH